ncbi:hypothetical protein CSA17_00680 [bacterium DOLJORAL78_65_58]|nr:MAG: hypothetical protein CSB20_01000 [bacterium DOLZORAL124_64_63]PIE76727.1 MAG: hypothetical protein CSA17_00680 [bacterium DOLJORAL78_65_58]
MRHNLRAAFIVLTTVSLGLLSLYEITAKSPRLLGRQLPGWRKTCRVEEATPWRQPTGIFLLDKFLHEGREALVFYGLEQGLPPKSPQGRLRGPRRSALSSRSPSRDK